MSATATEGPRIGLVGGGIMGTGIAEVCVRSGLDTKLVEVDAAAAEGARGRVVHSLERAVERGKVDSSDAEAALGRLECAADFDQLADRTVVVEAVVEDRDTKLGVFRRLAETVEDPEAILASNTSSIPIVQLAAESGERGDHVLGMHFFNPVPVLSLVEIIPSLLTDPEVVQRARAFARERLGKDPIDAPDRAGFTVNALLVPYLLSAIRMFEQGLATAEDIDQGMVKGCAHPMGPLALCDLIGLDTVMSVAETLYNEHREQLFAPPPLLQRLVAANMLGRKTGRGLYSYDDG
ncbi:MAG: 3-hydroxybutyryl-CoA dehydrogenase [Solirubrobacterales bacterium]